MFFHDHSRFIYKISWAWAFILFLVMTGGGGHRIKFLKDMLIDILVHWIRVETSEGGRIEGVQVIHPSNLEEFSWSRRANHRQSKEWIGNAG